MIITKTYRTKPLVIQAIQYTPENALMIIEWADGDIELTIGHSGVGMYIKTLEGVMKADLGDFVIKGLRGEFYACKPDTFHPKYEEITPQPPEGLYKSETENM